jgi:1,4-alpha-glucan branching enzyme
MKLPDGHSPGQAPLAASVPVISTPIMRVQAGTHHDPFEVLGLHPSLMAAC